MSDASDASDADADGADLGLRSGAGRNAEERRGRGSGAERGELCAGDVVARSPARRFSCTSAGAAATARGARRRRASSRMVGLRLVLGGGVGIKFCFAGV